MRGWDAGGCEVGALTVDGVVDVLGEGIVNDTDEGFELVGKGEGDGDVGMGVDEVCGSVYWVNDERWGGGEATRGGGFLAEEPGEKDVRVVEGCVR